MTFNYWYHFSYIFKKMKIICHFIIKQKNKRIFSNHPYMEIDKSLFLSI